jgi:hypothetical protein
MTAGAVPELLAMHYTTIPLVCLALPLSLAGAAPAHPRLPVSLGSSDAASYRNSVAQVVALPEADLLRLIPAQSGIYFTDCPNCDAGIQEGQFEGGKDATHTPWDPAKPRVMRCAYCGHQYPSEKFPMAKAQEVHGPNGQPATFPYWEDAKGYRHFFGARIDYHRIRYMETMGWRLGRAYWLTKEPQYARRCALILQRFAALFPGYCYHFDYPFTQKIIKDGNVEPKDFQPVYRVARWTWWAYLDIPTRLIEAYDFIADSGELEKLSTELGHDVKPEIEAFFAESVRQVMANPDDLTNMSPGMWADFIQAGRALERPEWVHEAIARLERFVATGFNYDGTWSEGAPSYHSQVVGNLQGVERAAAGYSDPPGYQHPETKRRFDALDLQATLPAVKRAGASLEQMRLPNGRFVPVHDTWSSNGGQALPKSRPWLLPALGHACLAGGVEEALWQIKPEPQAQWQVHLTWSPGMGHTHYDGLSLLLFASGQELLSDLGYTHSRDRAWTLPTVAHNTVVIDHLNQVADRGTFGNLRFFSADNLACQFVSVDNPQVYPKLATTYRRTLIAVNGEYVVDLFEVEGGQQHDYFLHGCADLTGTVLAGQGDAALATAAVATLLPAGTAFQEARNEGECGESVKPGSAYGYLRDVQRAADPLPATCTLDFTLTDNPARLRAYLLTQPGDQLFLGRTPAVRGAKENDDNLRTCWRPFAMLRHRGGQSVFATVLALNATTPLAVRRLELPGAALALDVTNGERHDLILLRPRGLQGDWQGQALAAEAELAVIRGSGREAGPKPTPVFTVVDGRIAWGKDATETSPVKTARLLAADRQAGTLTVEGEMRLPAGTVVLLDQAGQRVSPFTIVKAERDGANTRLTVAEDVGFVYAAAAETSTFICQPKTTHQGQHQVRVVPVAHLGGPG